MPSATEELLQAALSKKRVSCPVLTQRDSDVLSSTQDEDEEEDNALLRIANQRKQTVS